MAVLIITLVTVLITTYIFICGVFGQPNPITWFRGDLSDDEFKVMLDLIFSDKKLRIDEYRVRGADYDCWVANGYAFFKVNDNKNFTPYQRILFFRELKKYVNRTKTDTLNKKKLAELAFNKQLDSILDEEDKV